MKGGPAQVVFSRHRPRHHLRCNRSPRWTAGTSIERGVINQPAIGLPAAACAPMLLAMFIVRTRFRVVGDPWEPSAQLDSSRELSLLIKHGTDRGGIGLGHVRTIAGWKPLPSPPCSVIRLRPSGASRGEFHRPPAPEIPVSTSS
jgi:hypothetical protein